MTDTSSMRELIEKFKGLKIAVLGDLMMDEYVWGNASRVSPESPVLVIDVERETAVPGGAANVAANVTALGAKAIVFGAVGADAHGEELCRALSERGSDTAGIVVDDSRPTTRKTRVVAQNQQVLRVDREKTHAMPNAPSQDLVTKLGSVLESVDAVLVSDYAKGVVNDLTVPSTIAATRLAGKPFIANGKPGNTHLLAGASIVSLNLVEAIAASGDKSFSGDDIDAAGFTLREKLGVDTLVVTRGPRGLTAWSKDGSVVSVPAHRVEVYDVAGAGDTAITTLALAVAAGASLEQAAQLAVLAAAIVIGKVGVATVGADELIAHL